MATLGSLGALGFFSLGGSSAKKSQGPPINAQSPDEEKFIKYVARSDVLMIAATKLLFVTWRLILFRDFLAQAEQDGKNSHGNNVDATKKDAGR